MLRGIACPGVPNRRLPPIPSATKTQHSDRSVSSEERGGQRAFSTLRESRIRKCSRIAVRMKEGRLKLVGQPPFFCAPPPYHQTQGAKCVRSSTRGEPANGFICRDLYVAVFLIRDEPRGGQANDSRPVRGLFAHRAPLGRREARTEYAASVDSPP